MALEVDFFWHEMQSPDDLDRNIDAAVDALTAALRADSTRVWNPWTLGAARGEFRQRLRAACRGELVPVDQVAGIGDGRPPLFEIRWQNINVVRAASDGHVHEQALLRLIHGEPEWAYRVVALHAHEKVVLTTDEQTHAAQDAEIELAARRYILGEPSHWGRK